MASRAQNRCTVCRRPSVQAAHPSCLKRRRRKRVDRGKTVGLAVVRPRKAWRRFKRKTKRKVRGRWASTKSHRVKVPAPAGVAVASERSRVTAAQWHSRHGHG